MNFWDTSAVIALLVGQDGTKRVEEARAHDAVMVVWWGTVVECGSALGRLRREKALNPAQAKHAHAEMLRLSASWGEVDPSQIVRDRAIALIARYPLKAADAFQLAAATIALDPFNGPAVDAKIVSGVTVKGGDTLGDGPAFICLDRQLAAAAREEGLTVFPDG